MKFGTFGSGDGQIFFPKGIALDSAGNIYVTEAGVNERIQKFDSAGVFQMKFGTPGDGDGQFNTPHGIALDSAGNIYVADTDNNRIQKFVPNNGFSDILIGGTTEGTIDDVGDQILTITDEADPLGFKISADDFGGLTPATISFCGGESTFSVEKGDELIVTCGSVIVEVINGTIDISFVGDDGTVLTTPVEAGNGLTFDPTTFSITVPLTNSSPVVVTVDGQEITIDPGETESFGPTLVELVGFSATASRNGVILNWETATETDNAGFNLWRSEGNKTPFTKINDSLIMAQGGSTWGAEYKYTDEDVRDGKTYHYQMEVIVMKKNRIQFQKGISIEGFMSKYGTDDKCQSELFKLRWPNGFVCPTCSMKIRVTSKM